MASAMPDLWLPSQSRGITAYRPSTGTKLYCFVTETHVRKELAQDLYLKVEHPGVEPTTF